jgi:voltage-gated sodium channel
MIETQATSAGSLARSVNAARAAVRTVVECGAFQRCIIAVIVANAVVLGLETSGWAMANFGGLLRALDAIALSIFVVEIALKLIAYRLGYFRNAWNVFDFAIVSIALVPAAQGLSVLRALRVLRTLRLLSMVPKMRMVVQGLLAAIPAMASVLALLGLVFYIAAVIATKLFGSEFPGWFGTIGASLYSLFQIMTLESWSMGIVRPVMEVFPWAWVFFVPFILVTTFAVVNLFVAIIVNSMHNAADQEGKGGHQPLAELRDEVAMLRREIAAWRSEAASMVNGGENG